MLATPNRALVVSKMLDNAELCSYLCQLICLRNHSGLVRPPQYRHRVIKWPLHFNQTIDLSECLETVNPLAATELPDQVDRIMPTRLIPATAAFTLAHFTIHKPHLPLRMLAASLHLLACRSLMGASRLWVLEVTDSRP